MYFKKLELVGFKSFLEKTTLHFDPGITAVVGPNGCGKCLRYDSLVTLADGSNVKIGDLVETALKGASSMEKLDDGFMAIDNPDNTNILSLNPETLKIEPRPVHAFIKRKAPEHLLEIKTRSGKTITTTHYHPFFSIKDGQIREVKAEELKIGIRIATPRILKTATNNLKIKLFEIFKEFKSDDQVYITYSQELSDFLGTINVMSAEASGTLKINQVAVKSCLRGQAMNIANFVGILERAEISEVPGFVKSVKSRSSGKIILPREMNSAIARFLGYLVSEGRTTKENQVWFVNEDREVIEDFIRSANIGFGVEAKAFNYKKSAQDVLIFSSALCKFLERAFDFKISGLSKHKVVPPQIFNSGEKIIAEFLSALFEGDAYISTDRKGSGNYFEYATASKLLAEGVSNLLLQLGVISAIREKKKYASNTSLKKRRMHYSVYIYGIENVKRLANLLNFAGRKSQKLDRIKSLDYKTNPNLDLIPEINSSFNALIKLAGIKVKRFKKISPKLVSYYENRCLPTPQGLKESLSVVAEHSQLTGLARSIFGYLKILADSDIYWDKIIGIKQTFSEEWVYDLSILGSHNFVAQDMIVHNSNIFDSIRWVLGEQSAKSLRGSEMQDVIFNGTDAKDPLGMAEVSLTFDNNNKFFAVDHEEVVITRRIFRSGESEYLLNKTPVRLKDILDLLMGTGIGAENYSLVEQGKIDLLLSSRPEDRRLVFDEAAGITKYKAQKKEALRKLEETEQNLLRVNDIIQEVKRQISSLERQANKARRYKEVLTELKSKEINLAAQEIGELTAQKNNIINELKQLQLEEGRVLAEIQEGEAKINNHRQGLSSFQDKVMVIKNEILNKESSASANTERINFNREKIAELELNQRNLQAQIEQTKCRLVMDEKKINELKDERESLSKNIQAKKALLEEREAQLNNLGGSIKASLENIAATKMNILEVASKISHLKNEIADLINKQQVFLARKKRLEIEKSKVNEEKAQADGNLSNLTLELNQMQASFDGLHTELLNAREGWQRENLSLDRLKADIDNLEKEKLTLASHLEFLNKLRTKYKDISESMNATIYLDRQPADRVTGLVVKITDYPQTAGDGNALSEGTSFKLSGEAKPIDFDTQRINEKIGRIDNELASLENNKKASHSRIEEFNKNISELQESLRQNEMALVNKKASHQTALEQLDRIIEEGNIIVAEIADVEGGLSSLQEKLTGLKAKLDKQQDEQNGCEDLILEEQNNINLNNKLKEGFLITITQAKTELEAFSKQLDSDRDTFNILNGAYLQDKESLAGLNAQIQDNDNKRKALILEIEGLEESICSMRLDIQKQTQSLKEAEDKYQDISKGVNDVASGLELDRKEMDIIKNKLYELQMHDKDTDFKIASIKMRISQVYNVEMGIPVGSEGKRGDNPLTGKNLLQEEIGQLKKKLDACGTVNLVAIEEHDELKKRYDFLVQQQSDLISAKDSVHEAILKINRTTRKMFLETFEKVRLEFRNYFKLLFNGGDAQIFLVDENEPLESGIEIICRPPGKKLQNVLLLSGGEKSLSAIALIFAIFKIKPSLFCVLDEIDAALDEANVDRFSRILQEFAQNSQFIVITHNKKTIANASVMYGITMQESGVSKIVSVKFAQNRAVNDKETDTVGVSA